MEYILGFLAITIIISIILAILGMLFDWNDNLIKYSFVYLFIVIFVVLIMGILIDKKSPIFTLKKAEWTCTSEHTEFYGEMLSTVCDTYERNK